MWLDKCLKTPVLEDPPTSNMINRPKHICNLDDSTFKRLIDHCERYSVGKSIFQYYPKSQDCFVNTLTADDKYSLLNEDNFRQPIQILVSQKQKTFSQFFSAFLKSILNFEHFQATNILISDVFPKLRTPQKVIR